MTLTATPEVRTTTQVTIKYQRLCLWSAVVMLIGIFAGLITAGWFPPPSPGDSAEEVAAYYIDSGWRIRIGMITMVLLAPLALPLVALIGLHMWRMEGRRWAPLAIIQVTCGTLTVLAPVLPALLWLMNAYQPAGRPVSEVKLLHDMGWLLFVGTAFFALVQNLAIGIAALSTAEHEPTVFPRWVGYFNLWTALLYAPGVLVFCFSSGPMAWNGIVAFWIPVGAVGAWYIVMITLLFRADARTLYDWES